MAVARAWAVGLLGVEGHLVEVEADLANGIPGLTVTGLPDAALSEARDRVRAAVVNSGETWPARRITLALLPASVPKRGSAFDVSLAAAVLAASGAVPAAAVERLVLLGELGLDGRVRAVRGVLPCVVAAVAAGRCDVVVPLANLREARLVPGARARGVASLRDLARLLRGEDVDEALPEAAAAPAPCDAPDLADLAGAVEAREAAEVAAAGRHHLLLVGPPGCGKTMLAERLPGILPPLTLPEALEVTALHSVAGLLSDDAPLVDRPPFEDPHHSASASAVLGGGSGVARPGAASRAHRGVLLLDEAPEFASGVLDSLRQPLESGVVSLARSGGTVRYPARFLLVLAANPCPCARFGPDCTCTPDTRRRYLARLSGPLLDRIDLQVRLFRVQRSDVLAEGGTGEASAAVALRVAAARDRAAARYAGTPWTCNGDVPPVELQRRWPVPRLATRHLEQLLDRGVLTARGFHRVLRVAWTLADLDGSGVPDESHVARAVGLRSAGALASGDLAA